MKPGDVVKINSPFDKTFPGEYPVVHVFADGSCMVAVPGWLGDAAQYDPATGANFDGSFLTPIGATIDLATVLGALAPIPGVRVVEAPPETVSNAAARKAIIAAGFYDQVETLINVAGPTSDVYIAWNYATSFSRNSPLLAAMAQQVGLTSAQIDALFIVAGKVSF